MATIPLTQGAATLVDDEDLPTVEGYSWQLKRARKASYAMTQIKGEDGKWHTVHLHRLLMNAKPGEEVDHINGNGLDNRRANLRIASRQENRWNRRKGTGLTSQYLGVCWHKRKRRFAATIYPAGGRKNLGYFTNEADAARAYDAAAREHYGAFARLNFPRANEQQA